jgi:hypothetical protein
LLLTRYALERLLYRLGKSSYRDRFILKGAMLFLLWGDQPHCPTRDVDFLGFGDSSEAALRTIFRELCDTPVEDDGLILSGDSIQVETIRDEAEYGSIRVQLAVTEEYQALVHLGLANSRMKDFHDLWVIACEFEFGGQVLSETMGSTFSRRHTPLPTGTPSGFSTAFHKDPRENRQWRAFLHKIVFTATPSSLTEVRRLLQTFLLPHTQATIDKHVFREKWKPCGP